MSKEFDGKVVVVSGASRGIGFAIAAAFAREGAQTVLAASSAERLTAAADRIKAAGAIAAVTVAGDLRTLEACQRVHAVVQEKFRRRDVLVNSAGATRAGAFLAQPDEQWHDGFALKFYSCVRLCRLFWPMLKESHGFVVNINGGAARTPDPHFSVGGSVNGAVANFTKGALSTRKAGRRQRQWHPSGADRDRAHSPALRAACHRRRHYERGSQIARHLEGGYTAAGAA